MTNVRKKGAYWKDAGELPGLKVRLETAPEGLSRRFPQLTLPSSLVWDQWMSTINESVLPVLPSLSLN